MFQVIRANGGSGWIACSSDVPKQTDTLSLERSVQMVNLWQNQSHATPALIPFYSPLSLWTTWLCMLWWASAGSVGVNPMGMTHNVTLNTRMPTGPFQPYC